jgi:hypothetical protein
MMNHGSPLSKDHKIKKEAAPIKQKPKISQGIAKRILKDKTAGFVATFWLNNYLENKVQGECLPKSFLSNDCIAEITRTYGAGAEKFFEDIRVTYRREFGIPEPVVKVAAKAPVIEVEEEVEEEVDVEVDEVTLPG